MKRRKRMIAVLLSLLLLLPCLSACSREPREEKLTVVCTVFPLYDWAREIIGDSEGAEAVLLIGNGTDAHSYQPSAEDILRIRRAAVMVYVGGESDAWIEEALKGDAEGERQTVRLYDTEGVTLRQIAEESVASDCDEDCREEGHSHAHGGAETDEHIWLSLGNAAACVRAMTEALCAKDEDNAETYRSNAEEYLARLHTVKSSYEAFAKAIQGETLLFADRFPFVYLAEECGMRYVAAFRGCTTEADADPDTVIRLARTVDEQGLRTIFVTESSDGALAEAVRCATAAKDQHIVALDSLQSVTAADREAGVTYLSVMEKNLEILRQSLLPE